jgi:hypothetical protein
MPQEEDNQRLHDVGLHKHVHVHEIAVGLVKNILDFSGFAGIWEVEIRQTQAVYSIIGNI